MKLRIACRATDFIGRDKIEALLEDCIERHLKSRATPHGFACKELSAVISLQDDQEWFYIRLHMLVPPNTILVARGKSNQLQSAIEKALDTLFRHYENHIDRILQQDTNKRQSRRSRIDNLKDHHDTLSAQLFEEANTVIESLLPKLKNTIKRELTFLRSQGDLPYSYPATQDILDEVIAGVISDWKPGLDDKTVYIRLLQEMNEVLSGEVAASHVYGDIVSLEAPAPKNPMEHAESMVGEEFYEFYQPDELLKIEDLVFDEKSLMFLEKGQDDQKISYLLRLIKELPIKWRRAFILNELENIPLKKPVKIRVA
jgi:ribosome-associated translation inhibitor RaiA